MNAPPPPRPQPETPIRIGGGALVPLAMLISAAAVGLVALALAFGL